MKKTLLPIVVFVLTASIVYGLTVNLFPDNSQFPRLPTGPGTIGGALAKLIGTTALDTYIGDGTVTNSAKLDGVSASGYLKTVTCALSSSVMVGIDANGESLCGPKNKLLVGTWTEGVPAQKCPVGAGPCVPLSVGDTLYEGDIIKTTATSTGTITFADDLSILRLDTDTVVELQSGLNVGGETIAQAILNNGQLWGRILSNTGVNIGGGGVVAGVRGTSISILKSSTGQVSTHIVDSVLPYGAAILSGNVVSPYSLYPGSNFTFMSGATVTSPGVALIGSIYTSSPWIRENTKKDLEYLYQKKNDNLLALAKQLSASNEYDATLHITDIVALTGLCAGTPGTIFWPSLIGTPHERCQPVGRIAFADYSTGAQDTNLYTREGSKIFTGTGSAQPTGLKIWNPGDHIKYDNIDTAFLTSLSGKTLTINLVNTLGTTVGMLFDGTSAKIQYKYNSTLSCGTPSPGYKICRTVFTITDPYISPNADTLSTVDLPFKYGALGIIPDQFIIGALNLSGIFYQPIKNTIKSITIQ